MPVLTCDGCRQKSEWSELVRLVRRDGKVVWSRASAGRGAWVHRRFPCVDAAVKRALPRLFEKAALPSAESLWNEIVA